MSADIYNQAAAAQKAGKLAEAERLYRQIPGQVPEVLVNLANLLARQGRHGEAMKFYDQAVAARPDFFEALFNRGNLLLELKRSEDALESYDRVLAVRQDFAGVWNNRGTALRGLHRLDDALASFQRAATLAPGHYNALTNAAIVLWDMRRLPEALAAADRALAVQPGFAEALYVKANVLRDLSRMDDALLSYEAALKSNPDHSHALNGAAQVARIVCDWKRTEALTPQVIANAPGGHSVIQPFVLMGYADDPALQRRCAESLVRKFVAQRPALRNVRRHAHDKIRLAYLSADFHNHPTARLMAELFERHDRSRFEVTAFAFGPDDGSPLRARLKKAFDRFEDVRDKSDAEVARMMSAMEIDIAVDLNGHTAGGRQGIFAWRPASVQVNYLVYPGTTGATFMDVILADRIALPADQQANVREKIVHLPDSYQANDATRIVPPAPSRAEAGLPPTGFVFCCFNNSWKITAAMFDIWMRLLAQVDGSLLWLLDGPHADNLRKEAAARGVDPARLVFAPKLPAEQHLARHQLGQQPHPDVKHRRRDLPVVVEATEDKAGGRQSRLRARGRGPDDAGGVIGLVAVGQMDDLLAVERLLVQRQHDAVGDDIIHVGRAGGAGIDQIIHLHRRRPVGENAGPRIHGVAVQVHRDVDLALSQHLGDLESLISRTSSKWSNAARSRARIGLPSSGPKAMAETSKRRGHGVRTVRPSAPRWHGHENPPTDRPGGSCHGCMPRDGQRRPCRRHDRRMAFCAARCRAGSSLYPSKVKGWITVAVRRIAFSRGVSAAVRSQSHRVSAIRATPFRAWGWSGRAASACS